MADDSNPHNRPLVTRSEAKSAGIRHYTVGRICPRGHLPVYRFVSGGSCLACARERAVEFYAANPEKMRDRQRRWVKTNPAKAKETDERYRKTHPEKVIAKLAAYHATHQEEGKAYRKANRARLAANSTAYRLAYPERHRANETNRRAKKLLAGGTFTDVDVANMLKRQRGKCAHIWCRKPLSGGYHVDHILPLAKGGSNGPRNLQVLCPRCNRSKSDTHPINFAQRNGLLI